LRGWRDADTGDEGGDANPANGFTDFRG